jgi:hypothetical protein
MYDDYDLDYTYSNEFYAYDLDEMYDHYMHNKALDMQQQDAYENDDDYTRDSCDYSELAYKHYA